MELFIDGDGCPVKDEAIQIAQTFQLPVTLVTSFDHYSTKNESPAYKTVYVDPGSDSADYKIVALVHAGDIAITQDYGLASLLLAKNVTVLHQKFIYELATIDFLLQTRYEGQQLRKSGKRTKGPAPFTKEDRDHFEKLLTDVIKAKKTPEPLDRVLG